MSRTTHTYKGKEFPAKTKKKRKDRKHFGFTSGLHSDFERVKKFYKDELENSNESDPDYELKKRNWGKIKDKTYPEKNENFVKYGYGSGRKKKNNTKHG